jgi:hypothetical protein
MSINPITCGSQAMSSMQLLFWFCGVLVGVGFTLLSLRISDQIQRSMRSKRMREEEEAILQQREQEEAALIQLKQEEEAFDEFMDEQIDCAECHPMFHLSFLEPRLCQKHSQLAQKKATSQQHPIVCHSFTIEAEVL